MSLSRLSALVLSLLLAASPFVVLKVFAAATRPPTETVTAPRKSAVPDENGWVVMPAGARPAFLGIHGGTMPVSLLVYDGGSSLVTFVGRTGNDFLEVLRRKDAFPSLFNATTQRSSGRAGSPSANATAILLAGTGTSILPVFNLSGEGFARMSQQARQLQPFGLSDKPLSIEGKVTRPPQLVPVRQYPLLFQPHYLLPRR